MLHLDADRKKVIQATDTVESLHGVGQAQGFAMYGAAPGAPRVALSLQLQTPAKICHGLPLLILDRLIMVETFPWESYS